jgi:uncharacterized coiled-coil DUF342 family protein
MDPVIEKLKQLEEIITRHGGIISEDSEFLRQTLNIAPSAELEKQFTAITEENRLLTIGIIGRVKAGKSSVTNALYFDGKSILPEAPTPMTAALTVLSYGERDSVKAHFFSKEDVEIIRREHSEYQNTESELVKERKKASFEQFEQMKASSLDIDALSAQGEQSIPAASFADLKEKLQDFVGLSGKYMPFTKSVELELKHEALRDISIVDTPGINDPIKSREARTEEYLRKCDVVFIVSVAGQFLSAQDLELMDRLSTREGVQEIYLVSSMTDLGVTLRSEVQKAKKDLRAAIDGLRTRLSAHAADAIRSLKEKHPEIGRQFDVLINDIESHVLFTSSFCNTMSLRYAEHETWNDSMKNAWKNLSQNYPDYFDDDFSASGKASLDLLSGVSLLREKIDGVRGLKDKIISDKTLDFRAQQNAVIQKFHAGLVDRICEHIAQINASDLQGIKTKKAALEKAVETGSGVIELKLRETLDGVKRRLKQTLNSSLMRLNNAVSASADSETKEEERKQKNKGFRGGAARFFGAIFRKDDWGYEFFTARELRVGAVKSAINRELAAFNAGIEKAVFDETDRIKDSLPVEIKTIFREAVGDEAVDAALLHRAVIAMVFDYTEALFWDFQPPSFNYPVSGTISDDEIDDFINAWENFSFALPSFYSEKIKKLFESIESGKADKDPAAFVFTDLINQIKKLEDELSQKKETLDKLNAVKTALEEIA